MDDAGIDVAVLSLSTPGVHTGDSLKAPALTRRCNEFAAELVQARPDRFSAFACIPLPDIDTALEELAYALDVLRLDGVVLFTNANGVYLGDAHRVSDDTPSSGVGWATRERSPIIGSPLFDSAAVALVF